MLQRRIIGIFSCLLFIFAGVQPCLCDARSVSAASSEMQHHCCEEETPANERKQKDCESCGDCISTNSCREQLVLQQTQQISVSTENLAIQQGTVLTEPPVIQTSPIPILWLGRHGPPGPAIISSRLLPLIHQRWLV